MGIKVPVAKRSVDIVQGSVPQQQISAPTPSAFGGDVARARAGVGEQVQRTGDVLAQHMINRAKNDADEKEYQLGQQAESLFMQKMYGDGETEVVDPKTNVKRAIPAGVLRRSLHDAEGSASEVLKYSADVYKTLEPYKDSPYIYAQAKRRIDALSNSYYQKAISHEASEYDRAKRATYETGLSTQAKNMGLAVNEKDAEERFFGLGGVKESAMRLQALTGVDQGPKLSNAVQNYAMSRIAPNGDTTEAMTALNKYSNEIVKSDVDVISSLIQSRGQTQQKLFEAKSAEAAAEKRVTTLVDLSKKPWEDLDIDGIAETDPQLAQTVFKVREFMKDYNPKTPLNEQPLKSVGLTSAAQISEMRNYARTIQGVFMKNDNEGLAQFMLDELAKRGDGLTSSQKLQAFTNLAALKYAANNPKTPEDYKKIDWLNSIREGMNYLQSSLPFRSERNMIDFLVKNFQGGYKPREEVLKQAKDTLRADVTSVHKSVSKLPSLPNKIVDGDAAVEDLHSGLNELEGEPYSGSYADNPSE